MPVKCLPCDNRKYRQEQLRRLAISRPLNWSCNEEYKENKEWLAQRPTVLMAANEQTNGLNSIRRGNNKSMIRRPKKTGDWLYCPCAVLVWHQLMRFGPVLRENQEKPLEYYCHCHRQLVLVAYDYWNANWEAAIGGHSHWVLLT